MGAAIQFKAEKREKAGKGVARAARREGNVPAIVYGGTGGQVLVTLNKKDFMKEYTKAGFYSRVIEISLGNEKLKVLAKDVATNPVTDQPEHADFVRIVSGTKVKAKVRVIFANQDKAPGIKKGGILNIVRRELELNCNPEKIPDSITVDLSGLSIGDSIHINDIELPEGSESAIRGRNYTIATIVGRKAEEETAAVAAPMPGSTAEAAAAGATAPAAGAAAPAAGKDAAKPAADAKKK